MTARPRGRRSAARPATVLWTDRAINDLLAIEEYIAEDDPAAAARWVLQLAERARAAAAVPLGGRVVPELGRPDVREVFKRSYRIVYRVVLEGIEILTIFEGHRLFPEAVRGGSSGEDE